MQAVALPLQLLSHSKYEQTPVFHLVLSWTLFLLFLPGSPQSYCMRIFHISVVAGHPYFYVIFHCRRESKVSHTYLHHSVWNFQHLQYFLSISCELFQFFIGCLRCCEFYKLNFVKLMLSYKTSCIPSCSTGLRSEACRICNMLYGKVFHVKYLFLYMLVTGTSAVGIRK